MLRAPRKNTGILAHFLIGSLAVLVWSAPSIDAGEADVDGNIETGLQSVDTSPASTWFERYREVPDGVVLDALRFDWVPAGRNDFLEVSGWNAFRLDERYQVDFGRHGAYRVSLGYDALPHLFSREARSLLSRAGDSGVYTIADQIQTDFETLDSTASLAAGDTPGTATLARDLLSSTDAFEVGLVRQKTSARVLYTPRPGWRFELDGSSERRTGTRPLSNGSYIRESVGSGLLHTADTFRVLGLELPEPLEQRADHVSLSGTYARSAWLLGLRADFSQFENAVDFLTFDNPFRITDVASGTFRNRFSTGRLDLAPENRAASIGFTASGNLPGRSRITASVSVGRHEQDDLFPAYTLNSAISAAAGFDVTHPANLPASNLDGEVRTTAASLVATTRALKRVTFTGRVRYYEYDNRSRQILFPGYAAFGESAWLTNISGNPIENETQSYERGTGEVEVVWKVIRPLSLQLKLGRDAWDREERSVERARENFYELAARWNPLDWFGARAGARISRRDIGDYAGGLENADLRQFDQAERDRAAYRLDLDFSPGERVSFGISGDYRRDEYPESLFGLQQGTSGAAGFDLAWRAAERVNVSVHLGREDGEQDLQSAAKDDTVAGTNIFLSNYWTSEVRDAVDTYGARLDAALRPDKVLLSVSYNRSRAITEFDNANPNDPSAGKVRLANAEAFPWDDVRSDFQEARLRLSVRMRPGITLGGQYWYENLDLDDFAWDILEPYMLGISNDPVTETRRFLYLDSTYGSFHAHVVGAFARFEF
jgi:MtrB/PioB family decaheme-associated outer membrane protein